MVNTITVTQTFVGITKDGNRIYAVTAAALGDATSAAIAIPVTRLQRIIGTPGFAIVGDDQAAATQCYEVSTEVSVTTVTVTVSAVIESAKTVTLAGEVIGR